MTNFQYIISTLTQRDLAKVFTGHNFSNYDNPVYCAFRHWAESFSDNRGNCAYDHKTGKQYSGRMMPSIWAWEKIFFPNDKLMPYGRNENIAFQVWLDKQYNPKEWEKEK